MIKQFFVKNFPRLGIYKRFLKAFLDSKRSIKNTYSQHEEDVEILKLLESYDTNNSIYIDVGANHPSEISNTFLFYRNHYKGILVEPNKELINLSKRFRPLDIHVAVGCGNENLILPFHISKTPVLSSFKSNHAEETPFKIVYTPIMRLDDVVRSFLSKFKYFFLLSIDVEGYNFEVVEGATETLDNTLFLLIEFDDIYDKEKYRQVLPPYFELVDEFGCNQLYLNENLHLKHKK